ncbi:MAG: metallophosphoesterase family protein [Marinibacterium profundimaris]|uniref:Phosphodiesterase n=1 Tax=Marinibacterium profundimaris TaxID=1679460 RepID=A0A225NJL2_9RHOB|nr:phosphodiesterase [Marinibacterium profundimaris]
MKRLLHLSDLHFGRVRPELLDPLIARVNDLAPDLVAISGDLTQRARDWQFMRARELIDRIESPCLVVPGNHDTPLHRPIERLFFPWRRYRKWISEDLAPEFHEPGWSVIGLNSANPFSWQRGRYSSASLRCVRDGFADSPDTDFRIVVAHHPLDHRPEDEKRLTLGAERARAALAEARTDILLSGHLHSWRVDVFGKGPDDPAVLQVHAGTVLSSRLRGEENDFNLLTVGDGQVQVDRYANRADDSGYDMVRSARFRRNAAGWEQLSNDLAGRA